MYTEIEHLSIIEMHKYKEIIDDIFHKNNIRGTYARAIAYGFITKPKYSTNKTHAKWYRDTFAKITYLLHKENLSKIVPGANSYKYLLVNLKRIDCAALQTD